MNSKFRWLILLIIGTIVADFDQHSIEDVIKSNYIVNQALLVKIRKIMSYIEILFSSTDSVLVCRHLQFSIDLNSERYKTVRSVSLQKNLS